MSEELEQVIAVTMTEFQIPFEELDRVKVLYTEDRVMHTFRFGSQTIKALWTGDEWKITEMK